MSTEVSSPAIAADAAQGWRESQNDDQVFLPDNRGVGGSGNSTEPSPRDGQLRSSGSVSDGVGGALGLAQPSAEDLAAATLRIYEGCLDDLPPLNSKIVRIFTSSTFTDTTLERNALMERVYPKLKEYCREKHGLEFQVVDMRWGVRDEATDDHMTTELCMNEIKNCQRLSTGPNFVAFLGQKYGYRPIPTYIVAREFEMVRDCLKGSSADVELLNKWYRLDENTVPAVYVLQPISSILSNFNNKRNTKLQEADQNIWWETMGKLQKILRKAAQILYVMKKLDKEGVHNYFMSVTEREIQNGILKAKDTGSHCLAYVRSIEDMNMSMLRFVCNFIDMSGRSVDVEAQQLLKVLRDERLPRAIPPSNIAKFSVAWSGREGLDQLSHAKYLDEFTAHFYSSVTTLVDNAVARGGKLLLNDPILSDVVQHLHMCNSLAKQFKGRETVIFRIKDYLLHGQRRPLVLYGESGCGKTSVMAKAASMVCKWLPDRKSALLVRFLGTSPNSSSLAPLLTSLCHQLATLSGQPLDDVPEELAKLRTHFRKLMALTASAERHLVVFLDSLDQIASSSGDVAHKLSWLPLDLPPHVSLVVSALRGEPGGALEVFRRLMPSEAATSTTAVGAVYAVDLLLDESGLSRAGATNAAVDCNDIDDDERYLEVPPLGEQLGVQVLQSWLSSARHALTTAQWAVVREALEKCNLPLYVKLVFGEICRWRSYSRPQTTTLAPTVHDIINKLFDKIEQQHGRSLVSRALGYISASKSGLSEAELEDLLSLDEKVLNDVYQWHLPPVRRIPPLLWTRIRNDLSGYLTEREADGTNVINWYHRQFADVCRERYFRNLNFLSEMHSNIAEYFTGIWGGGRPKPFEYSDLQRQRFGMEKQGESDRKVPLQPNMYGDSSGKTVRYNVRKLNELPYHLLRSHRYDDLYAHCFFKYTFLRAKIACMPLQAALTDLEELLECFFDKETKLLSDTLRLSASILVHYPDMLGPQIVGRLLPLYGTSPRIRDLLEQCVSDGLEFCALMPTHHCYHTPGGPLQFSLEGHPFAPYGVAITSDLRHVISASSRLIMFDLGTGELIRTVIPPSEGMVTCLRVSPDDKWCVCATTLHQVIVCSLVTGDVTVIEKPVEEGEVSGVSCTSSDFVVWNAAAWYVYNMAGQLLARTPVHKATPLVEIDWKESRQHHFYLGCTDIQDNGMMFVVLNANIEAHFHFHSALAAAADGSLVYACIAISDNDVACYRRGKIGWHYERTLGTNTDDVYALTLSDDEHYLAATVAFGFKVWDLQAKLSKEGKYVALQLPSGIRNIPNRNTMKGMCLFTRRNEFLTAGVRKYIFVWDVKVGNLVKTLDAHFGRICTVTSVTQRQLNKIISSSIDKSIKVWNMENVYEDVHSVDRMEKSIDKILVASKANVALAVTRNCLGLFSLETGRILHVLSNGGGAIVTHAVVTDTGEYAVSAESGNVVIWNLTERSVIATKPVKDVHQLLLVPSSQPRDSKAAGDDSTASGSAADASPALSGGADGGGPRSTFLCLVLCSSGLLRTRCFAVRIGGDGAQAAIMRTAYEFEFDGLRKFKDAVLTCDAASLVCAVGGGKAGEATALAVYAARTGEFLQRFVVKYPGFVEFTHMVAMPTEPHLVGLIDDEKGSLVDLRRHVVSRSVPRWGGAVNPNGRLGLAAPSRGGLDVLDLGPKGGGRVLRTLVPRVAEGVFSVACAFTRNDRHVLYYHSGHRTLRAFRSSDGTLVAHFKCHAEATCMATSDDGLHVVLGGVDGSIIMLTIADPAYEDAARRALLALRPSGRHAAAVNGMGPSAAASLEDGDSGGGVVASTNVVAAKVIARARAARGSKACLIQ